MNLIEWTHAFIKYKDSVFRKIANIKVEDSFILVTLKDDSSLKYVCYTDLKSLNVANLSDERIVTLNTQANLKWLITNWDFIISTKALFYFVNPSKSESWSINPSMHHKIIEKGALKQGLISMFESVSLVN